MQKDDAAPELPPSEGPNPTLTGEDLLRRLISVLQRTAEPYIAKTLRLDARMHRFDRQTNDVIPGRTAAPPLDLLVGIDRQKAALSTLISRFAAGISTNHALLWGARGTGKSSLVKAVVAVLGEQSPQLKLVELASDDLAFLPTLFSRLDGRSERVVLLCDDLSFEEGAAGAKVLKSILEGGVAGPPDNVLIVATSNRRHLMPRAHEAGDDPLAMAEDADESLSISDRFGLWLGFPPMDQLTFLAAVHAYAKRFNLIAPDLDQRALQWAQLRGARSGRVAAQFIRHLAGELHRPRPI